MENKLIVANLKMCMDTNQVSEYLKKINERNLPKNIIICPSNIFIPYFLNNSYDVGVQNVFFRSIGEFTGEISPLQAKSMGIDYTILGHCERRIYFNESDSIINKKVLCALKHNMKVIFCIGESLEDKNMLRTDRVLKRQLLNGLKDVPIEKLNDVYIVYEPIWSVGTNNCATSYEIEKAICYIRDIVHEFLNFNDIKILYGGSVNDKNIEKLNKINNLNGFLLGNISTKIDEFLKIIKVVVNQ